MQPVLAQPALMTMGQHSGLLLFDLVYLSEFSRETEATEYIERSFFIRNWLAQLWRWRNPKTGRQQVGGPGELVMWFQSKIRQA